jgi:hypothetical protein
MTKRKTAESDHDAVSMETIAAEWDARFQAAEKRRAEGARFRRTVLDLAPFQINEYLNARSIDAYWLLGFAGIGKRDPTMQERSKRQRPGARGPRVWKPEVHRVAKEFFRAWQRDPARYLSWREFSAACLDEIARKTGTRVPAASLRRSILPTATFPRPQ